MKKYLFTQDCGIFLNQILIAVNCQYKDILDYAKKYGNKEFIDGIIQYKKTINSLLTKKGFVILNKTLNYGGLLYLENFENKWRYLKTLLHEIHHLVFMVARQKNFEDEMEAQAYLFDYLFSDIRRKLFDKIEKDKKIAKGKRLTNKKKGE